MLALLKIRAVLERPAGCECFSCIVIKLVDHWTGRCDRRSRRAGVLFLIICSTRTFVSNLVKRQRYFSALRTFDDAAVAPVAGLVVFRRRLLQFDDAAFAILLRRDFNGGVALIVSSVSVWWSMVMATYLLRRAPC